MQSLPEFKKLVKTRSSAEIIVINLAILFFALLSPHAGYHLMAGFLIESMVIGFFVIFTMLYKGIINLRPLSSLRHICFILFFFLSITLPFLAVIGASTGEVDFRPFIDSALHLQLWNSVIAILYYVYNSFWWLLLLFIAIHGYGWLRNLSQVDVSKLHYSDLAIPIILRILAVIGWCFVFFFFITVPFLLKDSGLLQDDQLKLVTNLISVTLLIFISIIKLYLELSSAISRHLINSKPHQDAQETTTAQEKTIPIKF